MNVIFHDVMTIDEACKYLRIPRSSLYKLAQAGKIPCKKVGRHWRFYRPKLTEWIAGELISKDVQIEDVDIQ